MIRISQEEINENKKNIILNLRKNYLSIERTFLATIRTISIFAGISILFINADLYLPANFILISAIILIIVSLIRYHKYKENIGKDVDSLEHFNPELYGLLLLIILFLILIYSGHKLLYFKKIKKK